MKMLVFGDIHGNLIALEKMFKAYEEKVDLMICHGDVVNFGPWSNECVLFLKDKDCICLKGNHEQAYLNGNYLGNNKMVQEVFKSTFKNFKHISILKTYREFYNIENYHISHTINGKYYYPNSDLSGLNLQKDTVIGHSHYSFVRQVNNKNYLINTGSVGQNRKNLAIINCAVIDTKKREVEIKHLTYNPNPMIKEMEIINYPKTCIDYYKSKLVNS